MIFGENAMTQSRFEEKAIPLLESHINELLKNKHFKNNPWLKYIRKTLDSVKQCRKNLPKKGEKEEWDGEFDELRVDFNNSLKNLDNAIFSLFHFNHFDIISFLLKKENNCLLSYFRETTFKKYSKYYSSTDIFSHIISRNAIETLDLLLKTGHMEYKFSHLQAAVEFQAEASFLYLLKKYPPNEKETLTLAEIAKNLGHLDILNKLSTGSEIKPDDFFYLISKAYRNSSMHEVENMCNKFLEYISIEYKEHSSPVQQLHEEFNKARELFPQWGSQIARYINPDAMHELNKFYKKKNGKIESEIQFGLNHFELVKKLCDDKSFRDSELKKINKLNKKCGLPITQNPPQYFMSMRDFTRIIAREHYEDAKKQNDPNAKSYKIFSTKGHYTDCYLNRYDHMMPFIEEMYKIKNIKITQSKKNKNNGIAYDLSYKKQMLAVASFDKFPGTELPMSWIHGGKEINQFWPDVEEIHKSILEMKKEDIEKNPEKFYEQVIKGIFLLGTLTPLDRGTGRLVEQWFAFVHYYHKLPIPVLKRGFQLDCLDLTFDVEDELFIYPKVALEFFEPKSLMKSALALNEKNKMDPVIQPIIKKIRDISTMLQEKEEKKIKDNTLLLAINNALNNVIQDKKTNNQDEINIAKTFQDFIKKQLQFYSETKKPIDIALLTQEISKTNRIMQDIHKSKESGRSKIRQLLHFNSPKSSICQLFNDFDDHLRNNPENLRKFTHGLSS